MVQVKYGDKEGYMDGYLQQNLDLYKNLVMKDRDNIQIGVGKEREGKSTLINSNLKYLDPTYNLDRCCFTGEDFIEKIRKIKEPYKALCWDESQEFTSRASISKFNRNMVQALSLIGTKNLFIGICLPSFFELDKYVAIHRSNCLIRVYSVLGDRGRFQFWNEEKKKLLYIQGKKFYDYNKVKPNFSGRFTKDNFPFDPKEYNEKKLQAMERGLAFDKVQQNKWKIQRDNLIHIMHSKYKIQQKDIAEDLRSRGLAISNGFVGDVCRDIEENLLENQG